MPTHREWNCGNIFVRPSLPMQTGLTCHFHKHNFDHMTIVWEGRLLVREMLENGVRREQVFERGDHYLVKAGAMHELTALEDGTRFWCIFAHRNSRGEIVEENVGWTPAYDVQRNDVDLSHLDADNYRGGF